MVVLYNIKKKSNKILDSNHGKFILPSSSRMARSVSIKADFHLQA